MMLLIQPWPCRGTKQPPRSTPALPDAVRGHPSALTTGLVVPGSGAIEINEAIALDTMFGLANESHCQLEDTGQCVGPGMPAACVGGDVCRNFNDPPNPDGCRSAAPTSGCDWVPALDCLAKNQDGRPVYADAAACPEHRNCRWMRSASCSLNLDEFLEAYRQLRQRYEPDHEVSTYACVGSPGFVYLSACVHAGMYARCCPDSHRQLLPPAAPAPPARMPGCGVS